MPNIGPETRFEPDRDSDPTGIRKQINKQQNVYPRAAKQENADLGNYRYARTAGDAEVHRLYIFRRDRKLPVFAQTISLR